MWHSYRWSKCLYLGGVAAQDRKAAKSKNIVLFPCTVCKNYCRRMISYLGKLKMKPNC